MGGARALIASLGASISLMAGAALSLLVVSFVFAYDGITDGIDTQAPQAAFVLTESPTGAPGRSGQQRPETVPVIIRATPTAAAQPSTRVDARTPRKPGVAPAPTRPSFNPGVAGFDPTPSPTPKPSGRAPAAGDGVREVGDVVSATVQRTGKTAGAATQILGPPVSKAIQDVLDLLTSVVQGATGGLADALDKLTTPRRAG